MVVSKKIVDELYSVKDTGYTFEFVHILIQSVFLHNKYRE